MNRVTEGFFHLCSSLAKSSGLKYANWSYKMYSLLFLLTVKVRRHIWLGHASTWSILSHTHTHIYTLQNYAWLGCFTKKPACLTKPKIFGLRGTLQRPHISGIKPQMWQIWKWESWSLCTMNPSSNLELRLEKVIYQPCSVNVEVSEFGLFVFFPITIGQLLALRGSTGS